MKKLLLISLLLLLIPTYIWPQDDLSLRYIGKAPTSLVGDGKYLIKTTPERFVAAKGLNLDGMLHFYRNQTELLPTSTLWNSTFFPGGVAYDIRIGKDSVYVMYGVMSQSGFTICIQCPTRLSVKLDLTNSIPLHRTEQQYSGTNCIFYTQNDVPMPAPNFKQAQQQLQSLYTQQLVLKSPNPTLDKSVAFSQYLLDLGYNGEIMLCEMFRWLDIWARDLGSGLLPGGLASGRTHNARQSLQYDIERYASMKPQDCKNSNDPSQGGTSSEVGWTVRSIWYYYLHSGDIATLRKDAEVMRPWVEHWITRDYDENGQTTDVTEFMDHMMMMLPTNGASSLATNASFGMSLKYFGIIEKELNNKKAADRLDTLYTRTVDALNTTYWNADKGYFNNMLMWDIYCERSSQTAQSQVLMINATDDVRAQQTLDYIRTHNWCEYGSETITPRMNHVSMLNDQNVKVWPWWNLWEAEARFRYNDKEGGYNLLRLAAQTIKDEKYPGLIEETLDIDGTSIGGNVFITAAGNLLEVVVKDLMGVEAIKPGWKEIKVVPAVPADWKDYECQLPTPNGMMNIVCVDGKLTIDIRDKNIQYVHVSDMNAVNVQGAQKKTYIAPYIAPREYKTVQSIAVPQLKESKSAVFYDAELHTEKPDLNLDAVDAEALGNIQNSPYRKVLVYGNSLPLYTRSGKSIKTALEAYVEKGGTVIFYGATVGHKSDEDGAGILGEQCGIIDWYEYLPARNKQAFSSWTFTPDPTNSYTYQKNGDYTATFMLDSSFGGKDLYLELGQLVGLDSVFINDRYVANYKDMEKFIQQEYPTNTRYPDSHRYKTLSRIYLLANGSDAHKAVKFGQQNTIRVKLFNDEMNYGFPATNGANIGVVTDLKTWQPTDDAIPHMGFNHPKRKGVNYWGSEQFFNSWSTKNGLFGFRIEGSGIKFQDGAALQGLAHQQVPVTTAYTDFALFKPFTFEVLAYTQTNEKLLYPSTTEQYPCIARIVNAKTGGGYILITPSVVDRPVGKEILQKLHVK